MHTDTNLGLYLPSKQTVTTACVCVYVWSEELVWISFDTKNNNVLYYLAVSNFDVPHLGD